MLSRNHSHLKEKKSKKKEKEKNSPPTAQIDNNLLRGFLPLPATSIIITIMMPITNLPRPPTPQEIPDQHINHVQPKMIASVDERRATLELVDEEAEEVRLVRVVELLHAALGDYAAAIRL